MGLVQEDDEQTVIRPRPAGAVDAAGAVDEVDAVGESGADDDTVIRERAPIAEEPRQTSDRVFPLVEPADGDTRRPVSAPSLRAVGAPAAAETRAAYRFRVNSHEPIALDVPAIIGRRPGRPRIPGGRPPRLVRVPSPSREVSGSHLELRQEGASVIATDLRSTNGTVVLMPGLAPRKLLQGESVVLSIGAVVDIGDGNTVELLPQERLVPPPK